MRSPESLPGKNKVEKSEIFSALKIVALRRHIYHAIHHKLPAIYHQFAPQIPATPLKNTSKSKLFGSATTPEKITILMIFFSLSGRFFWLHPEFADGNQDDQHHGA
jgi:hypothetical protein